MPEGTSAINSEVEEILARADRSRQGLVDAVSGVPEDTFASEASGEWGAGRILRHVVWVECYWTVLLRELCASEQPVLDLAGPKILPRLFQDASRLAGTPPESLPDLPPYSTRHEATEGLEASRGEFKSVVGALHAVDFQRRFSHPRRGVTSLRFAVEHVVEHDWDHAVQVTSLKVSHGR